MNNLFLKDIFVAMFLFLDCQVYVLAKKYTRRQLPIFNGPFIIFCYIF